MLDKRNQSCYDIEKRGTIPGGGSVFMRESVGKKQCYDGKKDRIQA